MSSHPTPLLTPEMSVAFRQIAKLEVEAIQADNRKKAIKRKREDDCAVAKAQLALHEARSQAAERQDRLKTLSQLLQECQDHGLCMFFRPGAPTPCCKPSAAVRLHPDVLLCQGHVTTCRKTEGSLAALVQRLEEIDDVFAPPQDPPTESEAPVDLPRPEGLDAYEAAKGLDAMNISQ